MAKKRLSNEPTILIILVALKTCRKFIHSLVDSTNDGTSRSFFSLLVLCCVARLKLWMSNLQALQAFISFSFILFLQLKLTWKKHRKNSYLLQSPGEFPLYPHDNLCRLLHGEFTVLPLSSLIFIRGFPTGCCCDKQAQTLAGPDQAFTSSF